MVYRIRVNDPMKGYLGSPTDSVIIITDHEKATVFHVNSCPDVE